MAATINIVMDMLESNQFNPEIIYNANLEILDSIIQLSCISTTVTTPPSASDGDVYIVGTGATGAWASKDNYIAYYYSGWKFIIPKVGWRAFDKDTDSYIYWNGSSWSNLILSGTFYSGSFEILDTSDNTSKVKFNTDNIPSATITYVNLPNSNVDLRKNNYVATTVPTSSDDSGDGYAVGSVWINTTTDRGYICVDSTLSASVWKEVASATGAGDVLGPATSTVNELARFNDTTGDYIKGSSVMLTDNKELYSYHVVVDEKVTHYRLTGTDSGKTIMINSSSNLNVTLPQTTTETIAKGFHCKVIRRGTGTVTFTVEGADTIESLFGYTTISGRYGEVNVTKIVNGTPNTWHLSGDLA